MKKSFFKRSLATLLSLLMVVGMFTVCSVGVLADEAPASTVVTLKEWSVDDLDAYAQKSGSLNAKGKPIYHVGEWVTGITRGANNADENWMFHSLSFTKGDKFTSSDTLVAKIHFNGDLGTASKLGYVELSYENRDNYRIELTQEAIQNSVLNPEVGEGIYTYTVEFSGSFAGAKQGGDDIQFRGKNAAGAVFNFYGAELYKKNANGTLTVINGTQVGKVRPAQQQCAFNNGAAQIGRKALISYSNGKTDGNVTVELTDADGNRYSEMHVGTPGQSQSIVKNVPMGALAAGNYTFTLDFATLYGLGNDKFTLQIYSGSKVVFSQKINQEYYNNDRNWTPDTGIQRVLNCNFTVPNDLAGRKFNYFIQFHDQTYLALFGAKLTQTYTADEAITSWDSQEILDATEDTQVVNTADLAEKTEVTVGVEANGGSGIWANCNVKGDSVTLTKGQTLRFEQDVFAPKGLSGNLFWRVYAPGNKAIIDASGWENYSSAEMKVHETYGYAYKTVTRTVTVPDAIFEGDATSWTGVLDHWMFANGADHANYPIRWYDYRVYDNGTDELLYTIKGETIASSKNDGTAVKEPIKVDLNAVEYETGLIATGSGDMPHGKYMKFDYYIKARDAKAGDELEIGLWFDAPNGYADGGAKLGARYRLRKADASEIDLAPEFFYGQAEIDNGTVSVATHETFGYQYVPVVKKITLTEEMATILADESNNYGINTLIGSPANRTTTFDAYPAVLYRYYVKNNTTGAVYVDKLGSEMVVGCGGQFTTNSVYSVAAPTETIPSATVLAEQEVPVSDLAAFVNTVGNYTMKFDVTGVADAGYTLMVNKITEEGVEAIKTIGFDATGEDEIIDITFDVVESDAKYSFGFVTGSEALEVRSVAFYCNSLQFQEDASFAQLVINRIEALPAEIALTDKEDVVAARAAYDELTDDQKALVAEDVLAKLVAAEETIADLEEAAAIDAAAAQAVTDAINALSAEITREDAEAVAAAREAYDALTDAQKALVDADAYTKLLNAEGILAAIADADAAQAVINLIEALPEEVTPENVNDVMAARDAYDALTDAQKALVHEDFVNKLVAAEEVLAAAIDTAAAQAVTDAINALNEEITVEDAEAIEAARVGYDALTDAQKALVAEETVAKLVAAEEALVVAIDAAAAQVVIDAINALPEEIAVEDAEAIEAARAAYDALTDAQKAFVTEEVLAKLTDAEAALIVAIDAAAAQVAIDAINALPEEIAVEDAEAIDAARAAYDALTDVQKAFVTEEVLAKLVAAEEALIVANDAAAAQVVTDAINALPEEIAVEDAEAIDAARAAYDALTDAQKAFVTEEVLAKLVAAEEALVAAIDAAAAQAVTDAINALPEELTEEDAEAVKAARLAYNALTDAQKALVAEETVAKLVAAEEALAINPDQVAADEVIALIEALDEEITLDDKDAVEAARAAFDALTDDQKALVENVEKLTAAEETIATLEKEIADQEAADAAAALIEALPEEITLDAAEDVAAVLAAVEALTETQKSLIDQALLAKLTAAEETVAALQQAAEDEAAAQAVTDAIAALTEESTEEEVAAARAAYEALTEAQKALVANETLEKLVALEEEIQKPDITYGDVDGNGKVDAADALMALQHAVKLTTLEGNDYLAADVNGDEKVDAADALLMLQYTVKLIDKFPVEEVIA